MTRKEKAIELFKSGYNCSQAVVLAFSDLVDIDEKTLIKLANPFGGGISRLREVCGAFSGIAMIMGLLYGYDNVDNIEDKKAIYEEVQSLAARFEKKNGSIICRQLLNLDVKHDNPNPSVRTNEYYQKRPCPELVGSAAEILEEYINNHPTKE